MDNDNAGTSGMKHCEFLPPCILILSRFWESRQFKTGQKKTLLVLPKGWKFHPTNFNIN